MATQEQNVWGNLSLEISQNPRNPIDFNTVGIEILSLDQLNGGFGAPPTLHLAHSVLSTQLDKSVCFLLGESVKTLDSVREVL